MLGWRFFILNFNLLYYFREGSAVPSVFRSLMQWPRYLFFVYLGVLRKVADCGGTEGCVVGCLRLEDKGGGEGNG
jgi:hypothetical protein